MSEPVTIALISAVGGVLSGLLGKLGYDKFVRNGNGRGVVEHVIAQRAEVEFQTRMTVLMGQLTAAIEKGHDKSVEQLERVGEAINEAAGAIKQVHEEIVVHRERVEGVVGVTYDTNRMVKELRDTQRRKYEP